jgi:hypothetical protein
MLEMIRCCRQNAIATFEKSSHLKWKREREFIADRGGKWQMNVHGRKIQALVEGYVCNHFLMLSVIEPSIQWQRQEIIKDHVQVLLA